MKVVINNIEPLDDDVQQALGRAFLLIMWSEGIKVDGVEVDWSNDE
jgi:hypothetical protein